jgi:hypothetical protein
MQNYRDQVAAQGPTPPDVKTFEKINIRELERDLFKQGASFQEIKAQVAAAEERNRAMQKELHKVKQQINAKYKDPDKRKAALQAYFDKVDEQNSRALSDYEYKKSQHQALLDEIDHDIEIERIRQNEAEQEAARRLYNDETRQLNREQQAAIRAQIEADKAELKAQTKAQAEAEKLASPEYQAQQEKQQVTTLKSLWRNAANGDEQGIMRDLQKLGVNPATVDMEAFIKEASSIGVVGRNASYTRRQQARQDKANAYNRPIPGVDEEPIQLVPRNTLYLKKDRDYPTTQQTPASKSQVDSFLRYQKEYDEIDSRNKRGAMPDWMARQEKNSAWQRHLKRTKEDEQ